MSSHRKYNTLFIPFLLFLFLAGCASRSEEAAPVQQISSNPSRTPATAVSTAGETGSAVASEESSEGGSAEAAGELEAEGDELDEFEAEFEEAKPDVYDPFEGYNRAMTSFNDFLYTWVLEPVGRGYAYVVPESPRRGVRNFFNNLLYPVRLVNNLLQLKVRNAGEETLRFVTNTTIGIFGFWDPAREWFGLEAHEEDFGQTLGYYGVAAGPHIVLPFLGPSNLRDTLSIYPDNFLDPKGQREPVGQTGNYVQEYGLWAFDAVNEASLRPGEYESLKKDAVDFYAFLRDGYEQMRRKEIEK